MRTQAAQSLPLGIGMPDDIAHAASYLASDGVSLPHAHMRTHAHTLQRCTTTPRAKKERCADCGVCGANFFGRVLSSQHRISSDGNHAALSVSVIAAPL